MLSLEWDVPIRPADIVLTLEPERDEPAVTATRADPTDPLARLPTRQPPRL